MGLESVSKPGRATGLVAEATGDAARLATGQRAAPGVGLETVIGTDERSRIGDTVPVPWRMIAALAIDGPFGRFVGTGWFAGPRTLITAGHCVFDDAQMGGWADLITITPGQSGAAAPFGALTATRFSTLTPWKDARDADFDIGAIHLDTAAGAASGAFAVAAQDDAALTGALVNVSGYPADKGGTEQWWAQNRVRALTPRRMFYDIDTAGGQSGAPVFVLDAARRPVVVGIHAYGTGGTPTTIPMEVNSAPRITPDIAARIAEWVAAGG